MRLKGITMIIRSLMGGGAERVMSTMANYWVAMGISVTIITSVSPETDAYPVDPRVRRVWLKPNLSLAQLLGFPWRISSLRKAIVEEGNDLVVSFMDRTNIPVIVATRSIGVKVVIAERIDPHTQNYGLLKKALMRMCYPCADAVTVLTSNVKKEWADKFLASHKVHVIHNPVLPLDIGGDEKPEWLPDKFICCMGRLHPQKGFDLLLKVMPEVFTRWPEYSLVILGEGENRKDLELQAEILGIADKVFMPGFIKNPHSIIQHASLFVFPSRFEGFPNALVESMAIGLPVVSFDCPSGPGFMIEPGKNGQLVPLEDTEALLKNILFMLDNPDKAAQMGAEAKKICKKCNPDFVMGMWTNLLEAVLEGKQNFVQDKSPFIKACQDFSK
ncbi:glycosyltransferase family 4 protein [Maridesulfovibrio sp.]|uniref:glycosyltransferase family 4 protein n=1 Tax=Maridesulfovibrio sp. TaxID=2795000 RepID=UPI002A18A409|nr:glycosyltransferase family 4 protein [Maridesulfovibrio sp.]